MRYIGILGSAPIDIITRTPELRKLLIFFDQLTIHQLESALSSFHKHARLLKGLGRMEEYYKTFIGEVELLANEGAVIDIPVDLNDPIRSEDYQTLRDKYFELQELSSLVDLDTKTKALKNKLMVMATGIERNVIADRMCAQAINHNYSDIISVPILDQNFNNREVGLHKQQMLMLTLKKMPILSQNVPIKDILEFRRDNEVQFKWKRLINWMNGLKRNNVTRIEFEEEFDYLLSEYEKAFSLHKLKYEYSALQLFVNTTAGILENLLRLKFTEVSNALFAIENQKIEMAKGELSLKGNEIAFITYSSEWILDKNAANIV